MPRILLVLALMLAATAVRAAQAAIVDKHGSRKGMPGRVAERRAAPARRASTATAAHQLSLDF